MSRPEPVDAMLQSSSDSIARAEIIDDTRYRRGFLSGRNDHIGVSVPVATCELGRYASFPLSKHTYPPSGVDPYRIHTATSGSGASSTGRLKPARTCPANWWLRSGRLEIQRPHDISGDPCVVQVLLGAGTGQFLREDLEPVAVGVEEVDALGQDVVGGELDLGATALESLIQLAKLFLTPVDLERRVGQAATADGLLVGHLDHGDVVIALPERKKGHLHLVEDVDHLHAERLGIELDRPRRISHSQHDMPDLLDPRHVHSSFWRHSIARVTHVRDRSFVPRPPASPGSRA